MTGATSPEHKPLVLAWVATVLTVVIFGGILLVVLSNRTSAVSTTDERFTGLSSSGEGRATDTPDVAEVTLGVDTRGETPTAAAADNAKRATAIVDAVKNAGVKPDDVQTINVSLNPDYEFSDDGQTRVIGYVASNTVRVTVRSVDQVGAVIDGSLAAGASNVQGIFFTFSPEKLRSLEDEARTEAMQDALRRATVLSQLSNVRLGKPNSISESLERPFEPEPFFSAAADGLGGGPTTPVEAGTLEVVTHVDVTYDIL